MSDSQSHQNRYAEQQDNSYNNQQQQREISDEFVDDNKSVYQDKNFFQIYGMFFCGVCKNMIAPLRGNGDLLQFKCKKCPPKSINFKNRSQNKCMLYSKALQKASRHTKADSKFIFDPTMPRIVIQCPDCEYHEAVYIVTPDQGERKILVKLICARGAEDFRVECGHIWDLDEETLMYKDVIKMAISKKNIEEQDDF